MGEPSLREHLDLLRFRRTADRVSDEREWSVPGAGAAQIGLGAIGLARGANPRLELEDSLQTDRAGLPGPARWWVQVDRILIAAAALHRRPATPEETRRRLELKGPSRCPRVRRGSATPCSTQGRLLTISAGTPRAAFLPIPRPMRVTRAHGSH
ncbi:3-keto-5-aminohexanoate cleavage protein [Streptomyces sp. NPDC060065]|uniref:3-keto-5-aminohexanoate cleavage protein n=1 Tax=Streptomyces sp. NPDC060065 TaxID=3347050 RepID=UPI00368652BF